MAKIKKFEDIGAWKQARELAKFVYEISLSSAFKKDFGLCDQIRRAAVSVMLNIAEGFARETDREFERFLTLAHGSTAEVQSALYVALDQGYITPEKFNIAYDLAEKTSKMIMGFIMYLNRKNN